MQALSTQKKLLIIFFTCLISLVFIFQVTRPEESDNFKLIITHKYYKFSSKLNHNNEAKYAIAEIIHDSRINY
jgi:hypothetical protein